LKRKMHLTSKLLNSVLAYDLVQEINCLDQLK